MEPHFERPFIKRFQGNKMELGASCMNKKILIITIAVLLTVISSILIKQKVDSDTYKNSLKLGRDLVESSIVNGNPISPHANVGENLRKVIVSHKDTLMEGYNVKSLHGDLPFPNGDGTAKYRLIITAKDFKLTIRLRPKSSRIFDVLGYSLR